MIFKIDKSFLKSAQKLKFPELNTKIKAILKEVESANSLAEIKQIKKLKGFKNFYRIKSGDYRIGIELTEKNELIFILIAHRKDIYKRFP